MLRSYQAELTGTQLVWLDAPPEPARRLRVLVVVDEAEVATASPVVAKIELVDLVGRLQWRGDAVQVQRDLRDEW